MTEQLLVLSLLKEELRSSLLLGRCRRRFRWAGLGLMGGWSFWRQASAAERNTPWMLFSDVNAEHSRYASAPTCFASEDPYSDRAMRTWMDVINIKRYQSSGCDWVTCSWEIGAIFCVDSSISVHTSVRRSVLQATRRMRASGQNSVISAFHYQRTMLS